MTPTEYAAFTAMSKHGGKFAKAIAEAAFSSDPENLAKIKATWPEMFSNYVNFTQHENKQTESK